MRKKTHLSEFDIEFESRALGGYEAKLIIINKVAFHQIILLLY